MWTLLSLFVKVLPDAIVNYMAKKEDTKSTIAKVQAKEEISKRKLQSEIVLKENDHWIAWVPRFVIALSVALYTAQVLISSMLGLPQYGPLKLPADFINVVMLVIGALFIEKVTGIIKR